MRTVELALRLIEVLSDGGAAGVSELSRRLDLPKSTLQRSLHTLADCGWIEFEAENRKWRTAARPILFFQRAARQSGSLYARAAREIERLRDVTGETATFSIREGDEVVTLDQQESAYAVKISLPIGAHALLHKTSAGLSIASTWSSDEIDAYVGRHLAGTPEDRDAFLEQVAEARQQGFAISTYRFADGIIAMSAPVRGAGAQTAAAISIAAPASRLDRQALEKLGPALLQSAARLDDR